MRSILVAALAGVCAACGGSNRPSRAVGSSTAPAHSRPASLSAPLSAASLLDDVAWLSGAEFSGRGFAQKGGYAAADAVSARFVALGYELHRIALPFGADNVIAVRRGGPRALLVTAHYDHLGQDSTGTVYWGADDNASGVAVMLGLAAELAARPPQRGEASVLFIAFGAEEEGLLGSRAYVAEPLWPLADTIAVINFDMVGRHLLQDLIDRPAAVAVVGLDELPGAREAILTAGKRHGLGIVPMPHQALELVGAAHRTDEWSFRRVGVPALHFSTGLHREYHQPEDVVGRIDAAQLERIARVSFDLLLMVLGRNPAGPNQETGRQIR